MVPGRFPSRHVPKDPHRRHPRRAEPPSAHADQRGTGGERPVKVLLHAVADRACCARSSPIAGPRTCVANAWRAASTTRRSTASCPKRAPIATGVSGLPMAAAIIRALIGEIGIDAGAVCRRTRTMASARGSRHCAAGRRRCKPGVYAHRGHRCADVGGARPRRQPASSRHGPAQGAQCGASGDRVGRYRWSERLCDRTGGSTADRRVHARRASHCATQVRPPGARHDGDTQRQAAGHPERHRHDGRPRARRPRRGPAGHR